MRSVIKKIFLYLIFFSTVGACISWWLGAPQNSDYLEEKYQGEASIIRLMMTFDLSDFPEWYVPTELVCGNIQGAEAASYSKRSLTILFNLPADISPEKFQAKFEQKSDLIRESCLAEVKTFIYESYVEQVTFLNSIQTYDDPSLEIAKKEYQDKVAYDYFIAMFELDGAKISTERVPRLIKPLTENTSFRVIAGALLGFCLGLCCSCQL